MIFILIISNLKKYDLNLHVGISESTNDIRRSPSNKMTHLDKNNDYTKTRYYRTTCQKTIKTTYSSNINTKKIT